MFCYDKGPLSRTHRILIIHAKNILLELAVLIALHPPDTVGRPGGIQISCQPVGLLIQIMTVKRLVYPDPPADNGRMIFVPCDHFFNIFYIDISPGLPAHILPAGRLLKYKEAYLITSFEKRTALWIMRASYRIDACLFDQIRI